MTGFLAPRVGRIADTLQTYVDRREVPGLVALIARGDAVHVVSAGLQDLGTGARMALDD